jgi:hypothetical protein
MGACFPEWLMINQFRPAYSVLLPKAQKQSSLGEIDAAIKRFGLNRLPSWAHDVGRISEASCQDKK